MKIKILTIPFDEKINGFDSEIIKDFILNKEVVKIRYNFLQTDKSY